MNLTALPLSAPPVEHFDPQFQLSLLRLVYPEQEVAQQVAQLQQLEPAV